MKPIRRHDLIEQDIGQTMLLYGTKGKVLHVLNSTAKLIWKLCDGEHSLEDMEQVIREKFPLSGKYDVAQNIHLALELFAGKGLLEKIVRDRRCKCIGTSRCYHDIEHRVIC